MQKFITTVAITIGVLTTFVVIAEQNDRIDELTTKLTVTQEHVTDHVQAVRIPLENKIKILQHDYNSLTAEYNNLLNRKSLDERQTDVLETFKPGVVAIIVEGENNGIGTGFFTRQVDDEFYVVTNQHVVQSYIDNPDTHKVVMYDHKTPWSYETELIGNDPVMDIAVLKVKKRTATEDWKVLKWANHDKTKQSDQVVIIGHGFSLPWSMSTGSITAMDRFQVRRMNLMIQTDAVINQGNSGGPMMNLDGEVIGVVDALIDPSGGASYSGIGLGIAGWQAQKAVDEIIENGSINYAWFNVNNRLASFEEIQGAEMKSAMIVDKLHPKSKEYSVGFRTGDFIVSVDGQRVKGPLDVHKYVLTKTPGDVVEIAVLRGGEEKRISYELPLFKQ